MKILIVSQHFYPEPFRINDIAKELVKSGHSVTVLTGLPNYPSGIIPNEYRSLKQRSELYEGVRILRTSIIGRGTSLNRMGLNYLSFAINASIRAFFLKERYDVVFCFQTSPVSMALPAIAYKSRHKIPFVLYCLDQWPISLTAGPFKEDTLAYRFFYHFSRWIYNQADTLLLSSQSFKAYFANVLKISSSDKNLTYWPSYAESLYQEIAHVENEQFDLVFAGNVGPAQNVEMIIEAANALKSYTDIHFHIVGDGLSLWACKQLAQKYNLNNVSFHGHHPVEEMPKYYAIADAFLITMVDNPVVNQTLPAKVQSYMAAKRPILGAINGEVRNVVEDAQCGLVTSSDDLKGFILNILEAQKNPNLRSKWAENGFKYYNEHFNKDILINQLISIFTENIQKGRN